MSSTLSGESKTMVKRGRGLLVSGSCWLLFYNSFIYQRKLHVTIKINSCYRISYQEQISNEGPSQKTTGPALHGVCGHLNKYVCVNSAQCTTLGCLSYIYIEDHGLCTLMHEIVR